MTFFISYSHDAFLCYVLCVFVTLGTNCFHMLLDCLLYLLLPQRDPFILGLVLIENFLIDYLLKINRN